MEFYRSYYDQNTGRAEVWMKHRGITYRGIARIHPDEKNKASQYAGCYYAEIKATIKALKAERQQLKGEIKVIKNFIKSCECYKNFDKESGAARVIYRQLNRRLSAVGRLDSRINELYLEFKKAVAKRDNFLTMMEKRAESRRTFEEALEKKRAKKNN